MECRQESALNAVPPEGWDGVTLYTIKTTGRHLHLPGVDTIFSRPMFDSVFDSVLAYLQRA